jgi:hypothetical protein
MRRECYRLINLIEEENEMIDNNTDEIVKWKRWVSVMYKICPLPLPLPLPLTLTSPDICRGCFFMELPIKASSIF